MMQGGYGGPFGWLAWLFSRGDRVTETVSHDKETQIAIPGLRALYGALGASVMIAAFQGTLWGSIHLFGNEAIFGIGVVLSVTLWIIASWYGLKSLGVIGDMRDPESASAGFWGSRSFWLMCLAGGMGVESALFTNATLTGWYYAHPLEMIGGLSVAVGLLLGGYLLFLWGWREQHQVYEIMPMARAMLQIIGPDMKKLIKASVLASGVEPTEDTEALIDQLRADIRAELGAAMRAQFQHQARPTHYAESQATVEERRLAAFKLDAAAFVILGMWEDAGLSRNQLIEQRDPENYVIMPSGQPLNRRLYTGIIRGLNNWQGHEKIVLVSRRGAELNTRLGFSTLVTALAELTIPDELQEVY